jgi:hypothetical protein
MVENTWNVNTDFIKFYIKYARILNPAVHF